MSSRTFAPRSNAKGGGWQVTGDGRWHGHPVPGKKHRRGRNAKRSPKCAYCKEEGHWMKDNRKGELLCPLLIAKEQKKEARRIQHKKVQQARQDALNSGEWLTYDRGAAAYKPTEQELDYAVSLAIHPDPRPVDSYDTSVMDGDNQFASLFIESDEESEKVTTGAQVAALRVQLQSLEARLFEIQEEYDGGAWGDHAMQSLPTEEEIAAVTAKLAALGVTV